MFSKKVTLRSRTSHYIIFDLNNFVNKNFGDIEVREKHQKHSDRKHVLNKVDKWKVMRNVEYPFINEKWPSNRCIFQVCRFEHAENL